MQCFAQTIQARKCSICSSVYTVKTQHYKQSSGYPELPNFMLASGNWDRMETMGNEQRQRQKMKTRPRNTERDFPVYHSLVAAVGNEEKGTDEP